MIDNYGFNNPEEAYQVGMQLLDKEDWKTLSRYYDLTGSNIDPKMLASGDFFKNDPNLYVGPPGELSKYKEPFPLGFKYMSATQQGTLVQVLLETTIEQGAETMAKVAYQFFYLRKCESGLKFIPRSLGTKLFDSTAGGTPALVE